MFTPISDGNIVLPVEQFVGLLLILVVVFAAIGYAGGRTDSETERISTKRRRALKPGESLSSWEDFHLAPIGTALFIGHERYCKLNDYHWLSDNGRTMTSKQLSLLSLEALVE